MKTKLEKEDNLIVGRKLITRYMREMGIYAILNSDQGSQFTSNDYTDFCKEVGTEQNRVWMARQGGLMM